MAETVSWSCRPDIDSPTGSPDEYLSVHRERGMPSSITVSESEIDLVEDTRLQEALRAQLDARRQKLGYVVIPIAYWPSGQYSHMWHVPREPLPSL